MKLTKYELRVARALMCAIFPAGADSKITENVADLDLEKFAIYATSEVPFKPALGFRAVIWMAILLPVFVVGRFRTFLGLSDDEREAFVSTLIYHRIYEIRALFVFFKAFTSLYYFTNIRLRDQVQEPIEHSGERPKALVQLGTKEVRHAS